jgi:uncharacterized protein YaiI (UPF0178 family)
MRVVIDPNGEHLFDAVKSVVTAKVQCCIICTESSAVKVRGFKTKIMPEEKSGMKSPIETAAHRQDVLITQDYRVVERCAPKGTKIMDYAGNLYFCREDSGAILVKNAVTESISVNRDRRMAPFVTSAQTIDTFKAALSRFLREYRAAAAKKEKELAAANRERAKLANEQKRRENLYSPREQAQTTDAEQKEPDKNVLRHDQNPGVCEDDHYDTYEYNVLDVDNDESAERDHYA